MLAPGELSRVLDPPPLMIRVSSLGGTRQAHAPTTPRSGSSPGIGLSHLAAPAVIPVLPTPSSIIALQTVPALVLACKLEGCIREVRGLCKQARTLATSAIDGLTLDCQAPVTEARMKEVLPLMKACCIKRLTVVLLCEGDEWLEEELKFMVAIIGEGLCHVEQLTIELRSATPLTAANPSNVKRVPSAAGATASVVRVLAPFCSSLTHLTVNICVLVSISYGDYSLLTLLNVLDKAGVAATLTHLLIKCSQFGSMKVVLDDVAVAVLSTFGHLTHLHLSNGVTIATPAVWGAVPSSLESLELGNVRAGPPRGVVLPSLQRMIFGHCGCSELAQLLNAAQQLSELRVRELRAPQNLQAVSDLISVYEHPLLRFDSTDSAVTVNVPLFTFLQADGPIGIMPIADVLGQMPVMPAFTIVQIHNRKDTGSWIPRVSRVFPCLVKLTLDMQMLSDADSLRIRTLRSLKTLELFHCNELTGDGVLALAATLPWVGTLNVERCSLVTRDDDLDIRDFMADRAYQNRIRGVLGVNPKTLTRIGSNGGSSLSPRHSTPH